MKAIWNGEIIAESNDIIKVEGNNYFPLASIKKEYLKKSDMQSVCPWKGKASYYTLEVDGKINKDAAWNYLVPKEAAKEIKERVAFWKDVEIVDS